MANWIYLPARKEAIDLDDYRRVQVKGTSVVLCGEDREFLALDNPEDVAAVIGPANIPAEAVKPPEPPQKAEVSKEAPAPKTAPAEKEPEAEAEAEAADDLLDAGDEDLAITP